MGEGGGVVFQMGDFIFEWRVRPMGRGIGFDGGVLEKKHTMGRGGAPHASHLCSEELKKCPPPSPAVQRFVNVVRERKPKLKKKILNT